MNLLYKVYSFYSKLALVNRFMRSAKHPRESQEQLLLEILKENQATAFGKEHGFGKIRSVKDFQERVRVRTYDQYSRYLSEPRRVLSDPPVYFSLTSGTMSSPKRFPITRKSIDAYTKSMQVFLYFAAKDHPGIFGGSVLSIISRTKERQGEREGPVSSFMYEQEPAVVKRFYAVPREVFDIEDYDARYYCIMRFAIEKDVRFVATPNPSTLLILFEKAKERREELIRDIEQGTLSRNLKIDNGLRSRLESRLRPKPEVASRLKGSDFIPRVYWPRLCLVACWKEGTLGHYIPQLREFIGDVHVRDLGLIATEAYCSIPLSDEMNAGVLALGANFYEFLNGKKACTAGELELGKEYSLVVTNHGGLYRYHLGDVVRVTGFYHATPIIKFISRGDNVTSITGEKLTERQVVSAMREACQKLRIEPHHFTFYANAEEARYDIYLEALSAAGGKYRLLARAVDDALGKLNFEYDEKRKSSRLGAPRLLMLDRESYSRLHKERSRRSHDAQIKMPVLTDKIIVAQELLGASGRKD